MSHHLLLVLHLLGAAIWVGGHLVLALGILPEVLRNRDPEILLSFEKKYEKIGIPALLVMVITGVWMAYDFGVDFTQWFHFTNPVESAVSVKLILLFSTLLFALSANVFVLPKLSARTLPLMAFHIISVTVIGIFMLIVGSFFRYGGLSV
ncbi:copper resistance protein CopD [Chryseobacterium sp.]|uniref:copper resistance protein CopD n=1 Tax=Chryseobacterium sp. TaxID=1871047 RepID=UPI0012A8B931|nr:copper resistance protein CopD [Chryseobacterium sp.]QFG53785.1 copper resistance protein CopD [Chryseobacterium sp.]